MGWVSAIKWDGSIRLCLKILPVLNTMILHVLLFLPMIPTKSEPVLQSNQWQLRDAAHLFCSESCSVSLCCLAVKSSCTENKRSLQSPRWTHAYGLPQEDYYRDWGPAVHHLHWGTNQKEWAQPDGLVLRLEVGKHSQPGWVIKHSNGLLRKACKLLFQMLLLAQWTPVYLWWLSCLGMDVGRKDRGYETSFFCQPCDTAPWCWSEI